MIKCNQTLVVKHNALINASYSLSLVEQRLILLAIVYLRQATHQRNLDYLAFDKPIVIRVDDYAKAFNVSKTTAYETLKEACKHLFERRFSFFEPREKGSAYVTTRWVSRIAYIDDYAMIEITFAPDVTPLITYLESHFTSYDIEQVAPLRSAYAIRLYELVISWRIAGKTGKISVQQLRNKLGIDDNQYNRMELFKRKVLEPAIQQINTHTDIILSYEQIKCGRKITDFNFKVKTKKVVEHDVKRDKNTVDMFTNKTDNELEFKPLTAKQAIFFGNMLSRLTVENVANLSSLAGSLSEKEFGLKLAEILEKPDKHNKKTVERVFKALFEHTDYKPTAQ